MSSWIMTVDSSSLEISVSLPCITSIQDYFDNDYLSYLHEKGGGHGLLGDVDLDRILVIGDSHVRIILFTWLPDVIKAIKKTKS